MTEQKRTPIWLDCDPGHDDALAVILAGYHPGAELLGVSTVSGNGELHKITTNACMVLHAAGLDHIGVYAGQNRPLLRMSKHCPEIHGDSGMDLAHEEGTPVINDAELEKESRKLKRPEKAVFAMRDAVASILERDSDAVVNIVSVAPLTNVALFLTLCPEIIPHIKVVCMGGCLGIGNIGPVVEFNFNCDPEAAKIVFQSGVHLTMIPLEVTHTALATDSISVRMGTVAETTNHTVCRTTNFKILINQLMRFFAKTYKTVYDFDDPPIHDPCAVLCALHPELFKLEFMRVDIETFSELSAGQSVCDIWKQSNRPANCYVARSMDVDRFWDLQIAAIEEADKRSPLNERD